MSPILAKNVVPSKLEFSEPKTLTNGSRTVYINYQGDKLMLQTPIMSLPYGIGDYNNKDSKAAGGDGFKKYDLHVSFRGMDSNPALKSLHDKMQEIETKIKEDCFKNRLTWLKDDFDGLKPATDRLFMPIVKYDKDRDTGKVVGRYPPTMKLKLPFDNKSNRFDFECMDMDGNETDFEGIMAKLKGAKARLIIQLSGMWFAGGRYGCTWKVLKARFQMSSNARVDFIEDDDDAGGDATHQSDEDVEEEALAIAAASKTPVNARKTTVQVPDSDEEEEDVAPSPPPAPKKPTTAARKLALPEPEEEEEEEEVAEEDVDSELEDLPPPPPPKKTTTVKKATTKK